MRESSVLPSSSGADRSMAMSSLSKSVLPMSAAVVRPVKVSPRAPGRQIVAGLVRHHAIERQPEHDRCAADDEDRRPLAAQGQGRQLRVGLFEEHRVRDEGPLVLLFWTVCWRAQDDLVDRAVAGRS